MMTIPFWIITFFIGLFIKSWAMGLYLRISATEEQRKELKADINQLADKWINILVKGN